jgi:hypothetical protein
MSVADEGKQSLECGGIRFTSEDLVEFDEDGIFAVMNRNEAARVLLRMGPSSEHPFAQAAVGVALMLLGIIPLYDFKVNGPDDLISAAIWIAVITVVGIGIIVGGLLPRFFLDVDSPSRGKIRFAFHGIRTVGEVVSFVKSVEMRFGYEIEIEVAMNGFPVCLIKPNQGGDVSGRAILR